MRLLPRRVSFQKLHLALHLCIPCMEMAEISETRRATVLALALDAEPPIKPKDIAGKTGINSASVRTIIRRYRDSRDCKTRPRTGRPFKFRRRSHSQERCTRPKAHPECFDRHHRKLHQHRLAPPTCKRLQLSNCADKAIPQQRQHQGEDTVGQK